MPTAPQYKVGQNAPQGLNIRSEPVVQLSTRKALLPMGHVVARESISSTIPWWEVSTTVQGTALQGFVNSTFLVPVTADIEPAPHGSLSPVHLHTTNPITRNGTGRAFPLNEANQPTRNPNSSTTDKAKELGHIIKWLDVENKKRYLATGGSTFCNIYSYDYCYLAGVFLPRVWWTQTALNKILAGIPQSPIYGQTVDELTANRIFNWLRDFGTDFGWRRTFDLTDMQNAANDGQVGIICGQRVDLHKPGHICPVVPETSTQKAVRSGSVVTKPLQSNAGAHNWQYIARVWWTTAQFREFGFWIHT